MPTPGIASFKLALVVVVALSLAAVALSFLAPGFSLDNDLVYGEF
jgi:hypothetical protein